MQLPNYFIADLPAEARPSAAMVAEACRVLKQNRERYLAGRTTQQMIEILSAVAANWLKPDDPFRVFAITSAQARTGFSPLTLAAGLDAFFSQLTGPNLRALIEQDLGHPQRLERLCASGGSTGHRSIAIAPEFLAHITAGNLPVPALSSLALGVLLRCAQFMKCARGSSFVPRLFAHSLYQAEPKLGACIELAEWPGGAADLDDTLVEHADCLTATGSDETLAAIRQRLPARVRFVSFGHRVSFAFVSASAQSGPATTRLPGLAAADVAAWNQLGCLSPHIIYVEQGGTLNAEGFARELAVELARVESTEPRGDLSIEEATAIASRRAIYQMRAAYSAETLIWGSPDSTAWTVVYEADPRFQVSCLNRFIYVKPVADLADTLRHADPVRGKVSTVGLAAAAEQAEQLALTLARWGVTRVCPLGKMQQPPLTWHHDGRPSLGDLVTWTDWETGS
jgi:hypothetical protein